jgi:hypothetical protein
VLCTYLGNCAFQTIFAPNLFFLLQINHKPLEWLTIVSNANGKRRRWISMLQDFHFKTIHHLGNKHFNVDALSKNPMFVLDENEDFQVEVLNQVVFVSKNATKDGIQFMTNNFKFHEIPNLFTLSKVTDDLLLETIKEKDLVMESHELWLLEDSLLNCFPFVQKERLLQLIMNKW